MLSIRGRLTWRLSSAEVIWHSHLNLSEVRCWMPCHSTLIYNCIWHTEEEHVNQYSLLETASKYLLRGNSTLGHVGLPQEIFPDERLKAILKEDQTMVKKQYPDYIPAADYIYHYRDMTLVTFAVDRVAHFLTVSLPVFIKDYHQPSLAMYVLQWCNPLSPGTPGNLTSHLCWAWLAGSGCRIHAGGYLSTDDTERSHF